MATKAELLASIAKVSLMLQEVAKVASAMPDDPAADTTIPSTPTNSVPVAVKSNADGTEFSVAAVAGIDTVKWVTADGDTGHWYGPIASLPVTTTYGPPVRPYYKKEGDFALVMWGGDAGMTNSIKVTPYKAAKPPTTPPPTQTPQPPVPPAPTGSANRFTFVKGLRAGVNLERLHVAGMSYLGKKMSDPDYYKYLLSVGVNWSRFFSPVNYTMDRGCGVGIPGQWCIDALLDCAQAANTAGQYSVYGPLDVFGDAELAHWDNVKGWVDLAAKRVSERGLDPSKFAFELVNEWMTDDQSLVCAKQNELYAIARARLPNHRIIVNGAYYGNWSNFVDGWVPPPDGDFIIQAHHYEKRSDWSQVTGFLSTFAAKFNAPFYFGELGDDFQHMDQASCQDRWAENISALAATGGRTPFAAWAVIGDQHDFRMNRSSTDPTLTAVLERAMKSADAALSK